APPLQPDLARHRIARGVAHACDLYVEGIERKQRGAMLRGREQRGKKAILVRRADERLAMGESILHGKPSSRGLPRPRDQGPFGRFCPGSSDSMREVPTPR